MNAHITYSDRMELTATNTEGVVFKTNFEGRCIELEEALQAANDLFEYEDITHIHILSATTGEILAICEPDDEQINEEMTAREFADNLNRMCKSNSCKGCPMDDCGQLRFEYIHTAIAIVSAWAQEHKERSEK